MSHRAAVARAYGALWVTTASGAVLGAAGIRVLTVAHPYDALKANLATATSLLAHNPAVALWPLALVALDWPRHRITRTAGDALIAWQLVAHGLVVGNALAQQPTVWRFLPHLPAEWLGLALPAAGWLLDRHTPISRRRLLSCAIGSLVALTTAAAVETWVVPL
jgi:hypothetical protein